jgi:hypothetical protein
MEAAELVMKGGENQEAQDVDTLDLVQDQMVAREKVAMIEDETQTVVIGGIAEGRAHPIGITAEMLIT